MTRNILKVGGKNLNSENWEVFHPNGKHMFTCGEKKANWYLSKNLAKVINDFKIELTFEPNGFGFDEAEEFGLVARNLYCVVTGKENNLQRHHIVPYCYRSNFPPLYKSKNHHDVVLLNYEIHERYEKEASLYKNVIGEIYGVKTIEELNLEYTRALYDFSKEKTILLSKFHTIFHGYGVIPKEIVLENLKHISMHTNITEKRIMSMNYIDLYRIFEYLKELFFNEIEEFKKENRIYYDHGFQVVAKLDTEEKIIDFVKLWRTHFIETMNPQFMPTGWSIDFRTKMRN